MRGSLRNPAHEKGAAKRGPFLTFVTVRRAWLSAGPPQRWLTGT